MLALGVITVRVAMSTCWCQKTPSFPGPLPVEYTLQAGMVIGGRQLSSSPLQPLSHYVLKFGSSPHQSTA